MTSLNCTSTLKLFTMIFGGVFIVSSCGPIGPALPTDVPLTYEIPTPETEGVVTEVPTENEDELETGWGFQATCVENKIVSVKILLYPSGGVSPYTFNPSPEKIKASPNDTVVVEVQSFDNKKGVAEITVPNTLPCDIVVVIEPPKKEICGNNKDDDGDGKKDEDCPPPSKEDCDNGIDDDDDGLIDSADSDCPPPPKEKCKNGIDDDGDRLIDSADPDCPPPPEICNNGIDDDRDKLVDSADPDCPPPPEICNNGIDDDRDKLVDSADPDCPPPPEICNNGIDDDRDGLVDSADPDCARRACDDGIDNDQDGYTDWPADPECKNKPDSDESQY